MRGINQNHDFQKINKNKKRKTTKIGYILFELSKREHLSEIHDIFAKIYMLTYKFYLEKSK